MRVVVCVGSNCGCRRKNVEDAVAWLGTQLGDIEASEVYASPDEYHVASAAVDADGGGVSEPRIYMNCVVAGECPLEAEALQSMCKEYELGHGRDEECRRLGDVPVDIDVVAAGDSILRPRDWNSLYFRRGYSAITTGLHGSRGRCR